jgi:hypothetical protein
LIGAVLIAMPTWARAGSPQSTKGTHIRKAAMKPAGFPSLCKQMPSPLKSWFQANGDIFSKELLTPGQDIDPALRPNSVVVCYADNVITVVAAWKFSKLTPKLENGVLVTPFYTYVPSRRVIGLNLNTPFKYLMAVNRNYWKRSIQYASCGESCTSEIPVNDYPKHTVWIVELRNQRSELLRTVYADNNGWLTATGQMLTKVGAYEPQTFRVQVQGNSPTLESPRTIAGELTQEGLVYQFFDLLDRKD